jgi:hypothetical protein
MYGKMGLNMSEPTSATVYTVLTFGNASEAPHPKPQGHI